MILPFIDTDTPAIVWASTALWTVARASALLAIAAIAQTLLRRRASAATRHLVWTLAIVSILMLPAVSALLPRWDTAVVSLPVAAASTARFVPAPAAAATSSLESPAVNVGEGEGDSGSHSHAVDAATASFDAVSAASAANAAAVATPVASPVASPVGTSSTTRSAFDLSSVSSWPILFLVVYAAGVLVLLLRQAAQRLTLARLARRSNEVSDPEWTRLFAECAQNLGVSRRVRLLRSREQTMPMAFGTRRPAILIPAVADTWPEDRRRAVLLHELAHVARLDCLTQVMAELACALYWMHPGVWLIARRLRVERELACDDRVLIAGTQAREYAGHLLEIAYSLGGQRAYALAVSMARPRQLEGRMLAVLDAARNRATPGLRGRLAGVAIASALLLPLAVIETRVVPAQASGDPAIGASRGSDVSGASSARHAADAPSDGPAAAATVGTRLLSGAVESARELLALDLTGTWEMRPGKTPDTVHLRLTELNNSSGFTIGVDRLDGLTAAQRTGEGGAVRFAIRRDAGTFDFEGVFRGGVGGGTFTFTPSPTFPDELAKRGFARPTAVDQRALARVDIGFAFIDELTAQAYQKPDLPLLVRAGEHGVGLDYLRGMGGLGYKLGSLETLIKQRDHGITPDYIRDLASLGYKGLSAEELLRARDHGVSADYVRQMRDLGYGSLTIDALVNARDHGVSGDYVSQLAELGYRKVPIEDLISVRDHGVSSDYVREVGALGYSKLSLEELVRARDHGLSSDYLKEMKDLGYGLPLDQLQKARDHGVSSDYVRDLAALGYRGMPIEELIQARDHGVSVDRVRRANARAGKTLPLDMIMAMADGGWK